MGEVKPKIRFRIPVVKVKWALPVKSVCSFCRHALYNELSEFELPVPKPGEEKFEVTQPWLDRKCPHKLVHMNYNKPIVLSIYQDIGKEIEALDGQTR